MLEIRYEDLVSKPEETVAAVCAFLELEYSPDMLAIEQTDRSKVVEDQAAWFTNVWAGITTAAVGKWKTELTPREVDVFESVAGDELRSARLRDERRRGITRRSSRRMPRMTRPCAA